MESKLKTIAHHTAAFSVTLLFLLPLLWMVVMSLRNPALPPPRTIEWWPSDPHWSNYSDIFNILPLARYIGNSFLLIAVALPVTVLTASWAGFGMSQLPHKPRRFLFLLSAVMLMVPGTAVWIFRFQILQTFGLIDSLWALIIPAFAASSPLFVLLYYWSYRQIPANIFESARLDGGSAFTLWRRMAQPLARPTTVGVTILTFVLYWNDFVTPVLYIYNTDLYTMPIGLQILKQYESDSWPYLMAGSVVTIVPIILLFILLQRSFLNNLSLATLFERN